MMDKPSYILDVEKTEGILSVMEIPYSVDKKYEDILKKTPVVYSNSLFEDKNKIVWFARIFKTAQSFYLYFGDGPKFYIYYKPSMLNELIFFINQLNKEKK
jgi:hypothetical protein